MAVTPHRSQALPDSFPQHSAGAPCLLPVLRRRLRSRRSNSLLREQRLRTLGEAEDRTADVLTTRSRNGPEGRVPTVKVDEGYKEWNAAALPWTIMSALRM
jgi:hypothetical protein